MRTDLSHALRSRSRTECARRGSTPWSRGSDAGTSRSSRNGGKAHPTESRTSRVGTRWRGARWFGSHLELSSARREHPGPSEARGPDRGRGDASDRGRTASATRLFDGPAIGSTRKTLIRRSSSTSRAHRREATTWWSRSSSPMTAAAERGKAAAASAVSETRSLSRSTPYRPADDAM